MNDISIQQQLEDIKSILIKHDGYFQQIFAHFQQINGKFQEIDGRFDEI